MATIYVTKTGNNANDGLTLATAKRTMYDSTANLGAYEASVDGDTILFGDGVYGAAEIENAAGVGFFTTTKTLTLDSVNPFGATLAGSGTVQVLRVNGAFANKSLTLGSITLAGDGVTPSYGILWAPTSGPATLNMGQVKTVVGSYGCNVTATNAIQVIITDDGSEHTSAKSALVAPTLGSNSSINLKGTKANITNKVTSTAVIQIIATGAGCSASVIEPIINVEYGSGMGALADFGVQILNIDNALIYKPIVNAKTNSVNGTIDAAVIDCNSATLTAHNGRILGGILSLDTNGGIGALIGHDTSNAGDDRCNFGVIQGVTVKGGSKWKTGTGHAVMASYSQDTTVTGNYVDGAGIGVVLKATTRGRGTGNILKNIINTGFSGYMDIKGATDSVMEGNECYMDNTSGIGMISKINGAVNSSGCKFSGNTFIVKSGITGKIADIDALEGTTFVKNIYCIAANATVSNPIASFGTTNYTTLADFLTANDASGEVLTSFPDEIAGVNKMVGLFKKVDSYRYEKYS